MASGIRTEIPKDGDELHQSKSRQQFRTVKSEVDALQLSAGTFGAIALTGNSSGPIKLRTAYTRTNVTTAGGGTNDFDLPAGVHGQKIIVVFIGGPQLATITPDSGVTIVTTTPSAIASLTLSTNDFCQLEFILDRWVLTFNNGCTVA